MTSHDIYFHVAKDSYIHPVSHDFMLMALENHPGLTLAAKSLNKSFVNHLFCLNSQISVLRNSAI
jgi:hypothetical protein